MLYRSILHNEGLKVLKKQLNNFDEEIIPTEHFEVNSNGKHQISGTGIEFKFISPYTCIYMDYMNIHFLENDQI